MAGPWRALPWGAPRLSALRAYLDVRPLWDGGPHRAVSCHLLGCHYIRSPVTSVWSFPWPGRPPRRGQQPFSPSLQAPTFSLRRSQCSRKSTCSKSHRFLPRTILKMKSLDLDTCVCIKRIGIVSTWARKHRLSHFFQNTWASVCHSSLPHRDRHTRNIYNSKSMLRTRAMES